MQLNNTAEFSNNRNKIDNNYIFNLAAKTAQRTSTNKLNNNNNNLHQNESHMSVNDSQCSSLDYLYQAISLIETKNQAQNGGVGKSLPSLNLSFNNEQNNHLNQLSNFYYQQNFSGNMQNFNNKSFGPIGGLPSYQPTTGNNTNTNSTNYFNINENNPSQKFASLKIPTSRLEKAKLIARQTSLTPSTSSSPVSSSSPLYLPSPTYSTNSSLVGSDIFNFNVSNQAQSNTDMVPNMLPLCFPPPPPLPLNIPYNNNLNFQNQSQSFHGQQAPNFMNTPFQQPNEQLFLQNLISALYALANSQQKLQQQQHFNPLLPHFQSSTNSFNNNQVPINLQMSNVQPAPTNTLTSKKKFDLSESLINKSCIIMGSNLSSDDISQKVDEHFKKSLGKKYFKIFTPSDNKKSKHNKTNNKNTISKINKNTSSVSKRISRLENLINKKQHLIMNDDIFNKICLYKGSNDDNNDINSNIYNTSSEYSIDDVYTNSGCQNESTTQTCVSLDKNNNNNNKECNCLNCRNDSRENNDNDNCNNDNDEVLNQNDNENLDNKNNFENGESCITQNECMVDADETQSLILSTTSSVSSERLSINTDVYYDEDEVEFLDNDVDSDASNNLIMNNSIDYDDDQEEPIENDLKINESNELVQVKN